MTASPRPARSRIRGLLRLSAPPAVVVLGLLAAVGALTAPGASLGMGAVLAALATAFLRMLRCGSVPEPPSLPHPALVATPLAVSPAAVAGTTTLGLGPSAVAAVGLAVAAATAAGWVAQAPRPPSGVPGPVRVPEPDDGSLLGLLRALPLDVLFDEWRRTIRPTTDDDTAARGRLRCLLVAELRHRDPVGTARWLSEAPDSPPDHWVRDARDRTA